MPFSPLPPAVGLPRIYNPAPTLPASELIEATSNLSADQRALRLAELEAARQAQAKADALERAKKTREETRVFQQWVYEKAGMLTTAMDVRDLKLVRRVIREMEAELDDLHASMSSKRVIKIINRMAVRKQNPMLVPSHELGFLGVASSLRAKFKVAFYIPRQGGVKRGVKKVAPTKVSK